MKLIDAPVIVKRFNPALPWILAAAAETRKRFEDPPAKNRQGKDQSDFPLKQLAEDIWAINGPLGIHTDKTRRGFRVIGLVLVNDPGLVLVQQEHVWRLPVGTVYHIDGRAPHGALLPIEHIRTVQGALFGFMAWDVHRNETLGELVDSIPEAMQAFADGKMRIDVSTIAKHISELDKL